MGHFLLPVDDPDLINSLDRGGQSTVYTEYLVVNHRREGQVVENLSGRLSLNVINTSLKVHYTVLTVESFFLCQ